MNHRSRVLGIGMSVPSRVVTNHELATMMETSNEWIIERTGIEERHWVSEGETGTTLATAASKQAIERAGLTPRDIDMIVLATLSPDFNFPGNGVFVQRSLGLKDIPCLDIRQQCTGFIYGLSIADAYIRTGAFKNILVIGAEVHSTGLDVSTLGRDVTVLFGDGAGAVVVGRATDEAHMILSTHIHADGSEAEILWTEYPASARNPRISAEAMAERKHYPVMNGKRVFKHAVTRMPAAIMEGMVTNQLQLTDIDMMIPHQANLRINQMVAQMIGMPPEKTHNNIQKYGNTTAASIPICMHEAIELGKIKPG
ncbi:MAG: 3-oxoacyl-ACP synthase III family protein, partial [bacterium]